MNLLKKIRADRGLTQKQLAELVGIKHQTIISDIEHERRRPKYELKKKIALALAEKVENIFLL